MPKKLEPKQDIRSCKRCLCEVNDMVVPFVLDGTAYCPTCFVYRVLPENKDRFYVKGMWAIRCNRCGKQSVSVGRKVCMQCKPVAGRQFPVVLLSEPN